MVQEPSADSWSGDVIYRIHFYNRSSLYNTLYFKNSPASNELEKVTMKVDLGTIRPSGSIRTEITLVEC